ncbi:MAG: dihydrolipoyl dehydrogenase [Candidatus Thermoplasmatota archaeon]|nr:dihydrolipoyl dehydrogenase [Candidatus Thermoplasmatota archaeon]
MKEYDLIVIGSGAGLNVASNAYKQGLNVAILDNGPLGGTCLNRGCIPTKIILYPADIVQMLREAEKVGVRAKLEEVDFHLIMKRMHDLVDGDVSNMTKGMKAARGKGLDLYSGTGEFVGKKMIEVNGERITAPKILIAAGTREYIPPVPGLEEAGYLTSTTALELKEPPGSLIIIGGGYIAAEFGHFFDAVGTEVKIVGRNRLLVPSEEPEISAELKRRLSLRMKVYTNHEVLRAGVEGSEKFVIAEDRSTNKKYRIRGKEIMVAVGRISNADLFHPEKSGIETAGKGWIKVDRYLRTSVEGIFAAGDAIGRNMFRHTANHEVDVAWKNMNGGSEEEMEEMDEHAVPHAVFTYPEIASVGMKEEEAVKKTVVMVGEASYTDAIKGYAMGDDGNSFVKVIVDAKTRRILGAHAIGPHATSMVQPLVYLMNAGSGDFMPLIRAQTIHPAMEEIMVNAFGNMRPGKGQEKYFQHQHAHGHNHGNGGDTEQHRH